MFSETLYFGDTIRTWVTAAAIAAGIFLVMKILRGVVVRRLGRIARATDNIVDDILVDIVKRTRHTFLAAISLYAGTRFLTLTAGTHQGLGIAMVVVTLVQTAVWGNVLIATTLGRAIRRRSGTDAGGATTLSILGVLSRIVLISILVLIGLDNLGVNVTGLVAGLGIGGIAVALALQNILGDLFASLSIGLDKPFVIGDFVVVGDLPGTVEHIGLKTTRVRSLWGEELVFSNSDLLNSRIRNFKRMNERRVLFTFGVTYQTRRETLPAIPAMIRDIIESRDNVRFDRAHFKEYGDSALVFEIVYYVLSPEYGLYMDIQEAINLGIFRKFDEEGIGFAYPTRMLYVQGMPDLAGIDTNYAPDHSRGGRA